DGGYGIPASDFDDLLTPMSSPLAIAMVDERAEIGSWGMVYDEVSMFSPYDRLQDLMRANPSAQHFPVSEGRPAHALDMHPGMRRELDLLINSMSVHERGSMASDIPGQLGIGISALDWASGVQLRGQERYATVEPG